MSNRMNKTAVQNLKVCDRVEIIKHSDTAYTIAVYLNGYVSKIHGADGEIIYKTETLARRAVKRLRSDLEPTLRDIQEPSNRVRIDLDLSQEQFKLLRRVFDTAYDSQREMWMDAQSTEKEREIGQLIHRIEQLHCHIFGTD